MSVATFTTDERGTWLEQSPHGQARAQRWKRRTRARAIAYIHEKGQPSDGTSPLKRLKSCGLAKAPDVIIKINNGHAFATGLISCGNIWTCPTCSERIRVRRTAEDEAALTLHTSTGGTIAMMTLTMRHDRTDPLAASIDDLNNAWRRLQQRRDFAPFRSMLAGTIATLEITIGENGWHPHLHILLLVNEAQGPEHPSYGAPHINDAITERCDDMRRTWSDLVNDSTDRYTLEHGLNLVFFGKDSAAAARYVNKIAKEINLTQHKTNGDTRDPFTLLDDTSPESTARYIEYAKATHRRQAKRWSQGLRRILNSTETTDEELADANTDVGEQILTLSRELWNSISEKERLAWVEFAEAQHNFSSL